jgi:hypothetical protein
MKATPGYWFAAFAVFLIALLVRGLYLADGVALLNTSDQDGTRMSRRYDDTALGILHGEGVLFPKVFDPARTGLASRPPGYSIFLAAIYATLGRSFPLAALVQDILSSLAAVLVLSLVRRVLGFWPAVFAGLLVALSPQIAATSNLILADAISSLPIVLGFGIALPVITGAVGPGNGQIARLTALGVLIGIGTWLRPNVLLLGPFAAVFLFFLLGSSRRALGLSALVAVSSLAVVAPITLRNWIVFGEFVPVSINGGITLWQGVADAGGREHGARMWDKQVIAEEAERYGRPDYLLWWAEPEGIKRDRDRYRRAMDVIKAKPGWYAQAMVRRMGSMMAYQDGPPALLPAAATAGRPQLPEVPLQKSPEFDVPLDEVSFVRTADAGAFLRGPLRVLHENWLAVAVLGWVGIVLGFRSQPRVASYWLIVPLYYLIFESPFLYEWRVAVPMQYFLLPFAGLALGALLPRRA